MPWIALLALSVSIDLVSSSARITSVKFQKHDSVTDIRTQRSDQGHLGPIKMKTHIGVCLKGRYPEYDGFTCMNIYWGQKGYIWAYQGGLYVFMLGHKFGKCIHSTLHLSAQNLHQPTSLQPDSTTFKNFFAGRFNI